MALPQRQQQLQSYRVVLRDGSEPFGVDFRDTPQGLCITGVQPGSAVGRAEVQHGLLATVNGTPVQGAQDLTAMKQAAAANGQLTFDFVIDTAFRPNAEEADSGRLELLRMKPGEFPEDLPTKIPNMKGVLYMRVMSKVNHEGKEYPRVISLSRHFLVVSTTNSVIKRLIPLQDLQAIQHEDTARGYLTLVRCKRPEHDLMLKHTANRHLPRSQPPSQAECDRFAAVASASVHDLCSRTIEVGWKSNLNGDARLKPAFKKEPNEVIEQFRRTCAARAQEEGRRPVSTAPPAWQQQQSQPAQQQQQPQQPPPAPWQQQPASQVSASQDDAPLPPPPVPPAFPAQAPPPPPPPPMEMLNGADNSGFDLLKPHVGVVSGAPLDDGSASAGSPAAGAREEPSSLPAYMPPQAAPQPSVASAAGGQPPPEAYEGATAAALHPPPPPSMPPSEAPSHNHNTHHHGGGGGGGGTTVLTARKTPEVRLASIHSAASASPQLPSAAVPLHAFLTRAAEDPAHPSHAEAASDLGRKYLEGQNGYTQDAETGRAYLVTAARAGDQRARDTLEEMRRGEGAGVHPRGVAPDGVLALDMQAEEARLRAEETELSERWGRVMDEVSGGGGGGARAPVPPQEAQQSPLRRGAGYDVVNPYDDQHQQPSNAGAVLNPYDEVVGPNHYFSAGGGGAGSPMRIEIRVDPSLKAAHVAPAKPFDMQACFLEI